MPSTAHASIREEFANLAARNRLPAQFHLRIDTDLKSHFPPKLGQHIRIARRFVSKSEVESLVHFAGVQFLLQNALGKLPRGHQGQIAAERKQQYCINAGGLEQAELLRSGRQQLQSSFGPQNPSRMRLKGDSNCLPPFGASPRNNLCKNLRMRPMYAVEVAYAEKGWTKIGRHILEFVKYLHRQEIVD